MTRTEMERLAVVEEKIDITLDRVARIEDKLDAAIGCKADKSEVSALRQSLDRKADAKDFSDLRKLMVGVLVSVAGTAVLIIVYIVLFRIGLK